MASEAPSSDRDSGTEALVDELSWGSTGDQIDVLHRRLSAVLGDDAPKFTNEFDDATATALAAFLGGMASSRSMS